MATVDEGRGQRQSDAEFFALRQAGAYETIREHYNTRSIHRRDAGELAERVAPAAYPSRALRYGCLGMEYVDLTRGALHFAEYGGLKPWDHAAGLLMHAEAGGFAAMAADEAAYRPLLEQRIRLLVAPDRQSWRELRAMMDFDH